MRNETEAALDKLDDYGWSLIENTEAMRVLFDWGQLPIPPLTVNVVGFDFFNTKGQDSPPLTVQIRHDEYQHVIHEFDPIDYIIGNWAGCGPAPLDADERAVINKAIAALQSGIDRLRAFEAACDASTAPESPATAD